MSTRPSGPGNAARRGHPAGSDSTAERLVAAPSVPHADTLPLQWRLVLPEAAHNPGKSDCRWHGPPPALGSASVRPDRPAPAPRNRRDDSPRTNTRRDR
eukprot:ctg_227.g130